MTIEETIPKPAVLPELLRLRASIDSIDTAIMELLVARFEVTQQVGEYKRDNGLPPRDPAREAEQFDRITQKAKQWNVDPELACGIFRLIIDAVVANHVQLQAMPAENTVLEV